MRLISQKHRFLGARLTPPDSRRIVVVTGARQVGKTTLVQARYPHLRYLNLDALEDRDALQTLHTRDWYRAVGPAVIDEAQKAPEVFEKLKFAYDAGQLDFSVLLGSSRFLLMDRVKESLAGRAFVFELWPLMPSEIRQQAVDPGATVGGPEPTPPLLDTLIAQTGPIADVLSQQAPVLLGDEAGARAAAIAHLMTWGGMPELLRLHDDDRREWLRSYQQTFLERDLADLVRVADLAPFRRLQRLAMLRSGGLLNYADLGRDADVSPSTARRYLEYLDLSYQVLLLPPFTTNLTSAMVKAPKLYWTDIGLLRHGTMQWGQLDGHQFETMVVVELHKWLVTAGRAAALSFYRTRSGMEVDLLVTTAAGVLGVEIKRRARVYGPDLRGLRAVGKALGARWRGGIVVTTGGEVRCLDEPAGLWQVGVERLL